MTQTFFNDEAYEMCVWSYQENNRLKASRIHKVAIQMEQRYRKYHHIPSDCNRIIRTHMITFGTTEATAKLVALHKIK